MNKNLQKAAFIAATLSGATFSAFAADAKPAEEPAEKPGDKAINLATGGDFETWAASTKIVPKKTPELQDDMVPLGWLVFQDAYERGANPDFEVKGKVTQDKTTKHGGEAALRLDAGLPTDIVEASLPLFKVEPNTRYIVRGWIKGENLTLNAKDGYGPMLWTNFGPQDFWKGQKALHKALAPKAALSTGRALKSQSPAAPKPCFCALFCSCGAHRARCGSMTWKSCPPVQSKQYRRFKRPVKRKLVR